MTVSATSTNRVTATGHEHEVDVAGLIELITPAYKWHNVKGQRVNGGTYVNERSYVIYVSISSRRTGHEYGVTITVDGLTVYQQAINPDGSGRSNGIVPVPPGSRYYGYSSNGFDRWLEMY